MKLLLDECVTRLLKKELAGHEVQTVDEAGLKGLKNGELLRRASEVFDVLVTVDQNISHQQNVRALDIAIVVLAARKNTYDALKPLIPQALEVLERITPGEIVKVTASP
jgi:predicted nuclease of predicted toxin-antitoxin system